ncbi:hypothetical protein [Gloeobacter morelensis]|uniref:Uncharacterized protein n=1 Tax=Gloeobacter morelensis MG652769 TaxID=2781736 RepID=A0ABY3PGJ4_9CYAN|nr:hypothetical protein [Gloeobacter morelensis]UFP92786.1 hypothetical protein ISF26_13200 [Gloeobacter morelensis MG652769]
MIRLDFEISEDVAGRLRAQAERKGLSLSQYLTKLAADAVEAEKGWPAGYFERLAGVWADERFEEPEELPYEKRSWKDF